MASCLPHGTAALLPQVPASSGKDQATVSRGRATPGPPAVRWPGYTLGWAMGTGPPSVHRLWGTEHPLGQGCQTPHGEERRKI